MALATSQRTSRRPQLQQSIWRTWRKAYSVTRTIRHATSVITNGSKPVRRLKVNRYRSATENSLKAMKRKGASVYEPVKEPRKRTAYCEMLLKRILPCTLTASDSQLAGEAPLGRTHPYTSSSAPEKVDDDESPQAIDVPAFRRPRLAGRLEPPRNVGGAGGGCDARGVIAFHRVSQRAHFHSTASSTSLQHMFCGCLHPQLPSAPYENDKMLSPSKPRHNEPQSFVNTSNKDAMANLVDLEEIVLNWARLIFDTTKSKAEAKIKKKYLCYNINWTKLFQESMEPEYGYQGAKGNVSAPKEEKVLFKTTFTNTTQREQEYSFKTERCTRSTSTVIIEKGVCRGMEVALKLKTPCEVVEANAGFHQEVQLNHIGENTNEEELCWGVDSCVRVPPSCETVAELVILEEQCRRDFRIENRMSGKVLVTVTNLKLNNSLVTVIEGNIADIIRGMPNYAAKGFTIEGNIVKYETKGTCIFRYGVEQKVKINETAIRSYYK